MMVQTHNGKTHQKTFWNKRPSEGMKSAVAYTFASLFSKGLAFVTVPIFTRIMSTSEMGTVNLYNSWQSILTVVATLSLTYGGYMVALKEYEHERDRYESSVLTLTTFTSIVFFAVYSVAPNFWSRILGLDKSLLLLMLVGFLLLPATEFWLARQRYEYKYKAATLVTIGSAIVASALSTVAVLYMRGSGKRPRTIVRELCRAICCCSCAMGIHHGARAQVHFHAVLEILTCSECASYCESVRHADSE